MIDRARMFFVNIVVGRFSSFGLLITLLVVFPFSANAFVNKCGDAAIPATTACSFCHGADSPNKSNGSCPAAPLPEPTQTDTTTPGTDTTANNSDDDEDMDNEVENETEEAENETDDDDGMDTGTKPENAGNGRTVKTRTQPTPGTGNRDFGKSRGMGGGKKPK